MQPWCGSSSPVSTSCAKYADDELCNETLSGTAVTCTTDATTGKRYALGEKPAATADVQHLQPGKLSTVLPGEHVTEVGEPARRDAAVQRVQRARFVPPRPAQPVVHVIVDGPRHNTKRKGQHPQLPPRPTLNGSS